MGNKRAAAVDILALVVTFFGFDAQVSTGSRVGGVLA